jgi:hypothetical protein
MPTAGHPAPAPNHRQDVPTTQPYPQPPLPAHDGGGGRPWRAPKLDPNDERVSAICCAPF